MTAGRSLDERYLEYCASAGAAFAAYPQLEPLRQYVFKELLVQQRADGWWQHAKHWLRPLHRRARTRICHRAQGLLLLESRREGGVGALVPLYRGVVRRGGRGALVSGGGAPRGPPPPG